MADNLMNIFSGSPCLSQQHLLDYLHGKLSEEEKNAMEQHLAGCELCSDALEGLAAIEHPEQIPVIVQQIRRQMKRELQHHQSGRKKLRLYAWLSAAVIITLLILLVAFFAIHYTQRHQQQMRQEQVKDSLMKLNR